MAFCSGCGMEVPDGTTVCAACSAKAPAPATGGMNDNLAGALCYIPGLGPIIAIIFLLIEPYNKSKSVRFNAFQALFLAVTWIGVWILLIIIPVIGWVLLPIAALGFFILLIVLFIKTLQGSMFKLPFLGEIAAKQAGA
jgi:uncharacterized membrane protein